MALTSVELQTEPYKDDTGDVSLERVLCANPEYGFRNAVHYFKTKPRSTVACFRLENRLIVGKRFNPLSSFSGFCRLLYISPAKRAYQNAFKLRAAGLHSPKPLAYVNARDGLQGISYLFTEWVDGVGADAFLADANVSTERKKAVLNRISAAVDKLHALGFVHRDLKARNLLIDAQDQVNFIDLDTMRRPKLARKRDRGHRKDHSRLYTSLPPSVLELNGHERLIDDFGYTTRPYDTRSHVWP